MTSEKLDTRRRLVDVVVANTPKQHLFQVPSQADAQIDIARLLDGFNLHKIRRFYHQKYWEQESTDASYAEKVEAALRLETVAEHSWHVADAVLLLAPHFPQLSLEKCLSIAVLHDKLEMFTGDFDPVGSDGTGERTHAFSKSRQDDKKQQELSALENYLATLGAASRRYQEEVFADVIEARQQEALFVQAVDKLQALAYVIAKKQGCMQDDHIYFTIRYSRKSVCYFPALRNHYYCLLDELLDLICEVRGVNRDDLERKLFSQYEFDFKKDAV